VEGLNMYRCFVKVFSGGSSATKFFYKCCAFAWGIPAIIVGVTAAVKPEMYGPASKTDPQFCVVRGTPFFISLLMPVCVILLGNMIVLGLVLHTLAKGSKKLAKGKKDEKKKWVGQARIAFSCAGLLGLTWLFAILAVGDATEVFQWLFCIFNSLQGFYIFIFYCYRSPEAKKEWRICLGLKVAKEASSRSGTFSTTRGSSDKSFFAGSFASKISLASLTNTFRKKRSNTSTDGVKSTSASMPARNRKKSEIPSGSSSARVTSTSETAGSSNLKNNKKKSTDLRF